MTRQVRGAESQYSQDPYLQVGNPSTGEEYNFRGSSKEVRGLSSTSASPAWGRSCTRKISQQGLFWDTQGAVGNRDSTLKGHTQTYTCSETQGRSSSLKGA